MLDPTVLLRPSVVALAASVLTLTACQRHDEQTPVDAVPVSTETPRITVGPPPVVSRSELLAAIDIAASAYAEGQESVRDSLSGRRFLIRQAFGCGEPEPLPDSAPDGLAHWRTIVPQEMVQLKLAPEDWSDSPLVSDGQKGWETVEGFWLSRPWLRSEGCPAAADEAQPQETLTPQTAGLAAVFNNDGSRLGRRNGRAYAFTVRGDADQAATTMPMNGYRLVLEGRFTDFANGRAIRCHAANADQRPVCIAAAQVDRVAFEDASGAVLSEWRPN